MPALLLALHCFSRKLSMIDEDDDEDEGAEVDEEVSLSYVADVLAMPVDMLLGQFAEAGMMLSGPEAPVTMAMKERLLDHLKRPRIIN
jgi:hypothetical protein